MDFFKHIITGIDNQTVDVARVLWIIGALSFLGLSAFDIYRSGHFDMANFALAYTGLLTGGAAGVRIKAITEPDHK
jgi:hypothetical protein